MAREPHVALFQDFTWLSGSHTDLSSIPHSIAKQRIHQKRPSKVTTTVVFSCLIARLAKLVSNYKILWSRATPMPNCMALMETHF